MSDEELKPGIHNRPPEMSDEDWDAHCQKHGLVTMTVGEFKKFVTAKRVEQRVENLSQGNRHQRRAAKVLAKTGKVVRKTTTYGSRDMKFRMVK